MENINKNNLTTYLLIGIFGLMAIATVQNGGAKTMELVQKSGDANTITVTADAERSMAPDTASVSFSMTSKNRNLSTATDSVNERVAEILSVLDEFGIKEADLKTTSYNVYPEYDYAKQTGERAFSGYRVSQSITVKIRDLEKTESVMTKVATLKVDNVSGLNFFIDNDEEVREELRAEAIEKAKKKAKKLAGELGVSLANIVGFTEGGNNYYPQPLYAAKSFDFAEESAVSASIPAGESDLSTSVSITFEISN